MSCFIITVLCLRVSVGGSVLCLIFFHFFSVEECLFLCESLRRVGIGSSQLFLCLLRIIMFPFNGICYH